jgi:hypothetical protein
MSDTPITPELSQVLAEVVALAKEVARLSSENVRLRAACMAALPWIPKRLSPEADAAADAVRAALSPQAPFETDAGKLGPRRM